MNEECRSKYVKFYANCFPVKGYSRSLICDLQFGVHQFIANELYDVLTHQPTLTLEELYAKFDVHEHETVTEYLEFLQEKDFIFFTDEPELFPALAKNWESPSEITNAVIAIERLPEVGFMEELISQLNELGCEAVLLRCSVVLSKEELNTILSKFDGSTILSIELDIMDSSYIDRNFLESLVVSYRRLVRIQIFGSKEDSGYTYLGVGVSYQPTSLLQKCGNVLPKYFSFFYKSIMEARCYNSCLNRKIYVDTKGQVRNCPFSDKLLGYFPANSLDSIANKQVFRHLWSITKDSIDVCKDCEFRYVCIDCRIFIKDSENSHSQPAKCSYNPYIVKWEHEEGYVPVEQCGTYSLSKGFEVDHKKVEELNKVLWE